MIDDSYSHDPEPPICRHRAGDPECMCHDEEERDEEPEVDSDAALIADIETAHRWYREACEAMPAVPPDIADDDIRAEVAEIRRRALEIIESMRGDLA